MGWWFGFGSLNADNLAELLVCYRQDANEPLGRHDGLNPLGVYDGILLAGTVPNIDRILHHRETIRKEFFPELRSLLSFVFCGDREIKKDKKPHDSVGLRCELGNHGMTG